MDPGTARRSGGANSLGLGALLALADLELDPLTLVEGLVPVGLMADQ